MIVQNCRKGQRSDIADGFTLVEVLLALAIFAIGILALGALQIRYISGNALARNQTVAVAAASEVLERLMAVPVETAGEMAAGDHGPRYFAGHQVTWRVTPDTPMEGIHSVNVKVYPNGRNGRTISVRYYISETVPLSYTIKEDPM